MTAGREGGPAEETGDEAIRPTPEGGDAGLDDLMRMDVGTLEEMLPQILDAVARGPLVLTRNGGAFAVLLPLDAYRSLVARADEVMPPHTVIDGEATPGED